MGYRSSWRTRIGKARLLARSPAGRRQLLGAVRSRLGGGRTPAQRLSDVTTPHNVITLEAVRVVVTLGIPDLVGSAPTDIDELASRVGANADALHRVLRHLIERGLLVETKPGQVRLTDAGALLQTGHPESRNAVFQLGVQYFEAALKDLMHSVRTGEPAFERVNGMPPWQLMAENPQVAASFDHQMNSHARALAPELLRVYDWSGITHIVDVGGGSGQLLRLLLRALPGVKGTLVEYADAAKRAQAVLASDDAVAGRCTVVEADFFVSVPSGGDAYVLSWILHDWADAQAEQILRKCAEAAAPTGRVLVVEKPLDVMPDTEMDLRMLVFYGGRERDRTEYESLAQRGGLTVASWTTLPSGFSVMDCRPRSSAGTRPSPLPAQRLP
jgi:SAM-dependent methyltransferase